MKRVRGGHKHEPLRAGPRPKVSTEMVLSAIVAGTRTTTRGVTIAQLMELFDGKHTTAHKRFRALLRDGLIQKIPGTLGEYMLTPKGMMLQLQSEGEPK